MVISGVKINVFEAKFKRKFRESTSLKTKYQDEGNMKSIRWHNVNNLDGRSYKQVVQDGKQRVDGEGKGANQNTERQVQRNGRIRNGDEESSGMKRTIVVDGQVSQENLQWLRRSIIRETDGTRGLEKGG